MRVENAPGMPVSFSKILSLTRWLAARSVAIVAGWEYSRSFWPLSTFTSP